ncbi:MAG: hypothetical protein ACE5JF_04965 [Anaerolineales bacterium]
MPNNSEVSAISLPKPFRAASPNGSETATFSLLKSLGAASQLLLIPILLAGCSRTETVSSQAPHYSGTFEASCSPVDAPAILLDLYRLGDPEPPMVSISVWHFQSPITGSQIELKERTGYGAAFIGGTEWIPAADGAIGFEDYEEGEMARGWFWLKLDGIDRIEGQFEATWSDSGLAICG